MPETIRPPLRYDASYETVEADEAQTSSAIADTMLKISGITYKDSGHALRSVHAKTHGLLKGELRVLDNLPDELKQGVFAHAGNYPAVMRFSTIPGDILDDSIGVPRGLAIKIVGVDGERLPGSENSRSQDFLFVSGPAFLAATPKKFHPGLKFLAATTDSPQILKKIGSGVLRALASVMEAFGKPSTLLHALGGAPQTHPLGITFWTEVPVLYGPYMAKVAAIPASPALLALKDARIAIGGRPNALRDEIANVMRNTAAEWDICVQLCNDRDAMPIEDASVVWPEDKSPFIPVARFTAPAQESWNERRTAASDALAFSPWNGIAAHRPLGSMMRARKEAYAKSAEFRRTRNGVTTAEPRSEADLAF